MFDPERTGRFIRFLAYAQKEIARMNAPLPPFNLVSRCPKCGMEGGGPDRRFDGVRVVLHAPDPFPVEYHPEALRPPDRRPCASALDIEHLCRVCPRCAFQWAEACPSAEDFLPTGPQHPVRDFQMDAGPISRLPVRPEVWRFALLMERQLAAHDDPAHDDRPGWKECSANYLFRRLEEEVAELGACIPGDIADRPLPSLVGRQAADAANFCMFIADVGGALATGEVKA